MKGENEGDPPVSLWSKTTKLPAFESLRKNIRTDVLIIGGGLAGILCAYKLQQAGVDYVLAEADTICSKMTKNTTAKITSQHGLLYHKLVKRFGTEKAALYLWANQEALQAYREMCREIDCDFEEKDSFVYSRDNPELIAKELDALRQLRFPAKFVQRTELPFPVAGAVCFTKQAQFHPLKFVQAISGKLKIYEHTKVREIVGHEAHTAGGTITAEKIIVTTHFPFLNKHGSYFMKMYQHRSYVMALEHAVRLKGMYVDAVRTGMSFRGCRDLLLLGGGGHRTGKAGGNWQELGRFAAQYYPEAGEYCRWSAQDCMTLDDVPYIGQYSKNTPAYYVATGFNKWGMTSSMAAAGLLADLITEKKNPYSEVFSPSRSILRPQIAINALEAAKSLVTVQGPRCPHLGCALKWNKAEHSWDCPCHGSRFDAKGQLIDNPATGDLKRKPGRDETKNML